MADLGKRTSDLPPKDTPYGTSDKIVIVYAPNTEIAQTAVITIRDLFANTANLQIECANLTLSDIRSNPANSAALTVAQGTMFFSSTFGYFAIANNNLVRWPISTF